MHSLAKIYIFVLSFTLTSFTQAKQPQHTDEIYYLTNCFNKHTSLPYAEIDYYNNRSLSAISDHPSPPDLKSVINPSASIDYEDGTWSTVAGALFTFTAMIGDDAYTASAGTVVGSVKEHVQRDDEVCEADESGCLHGEEGRMLFGLCLHRGE
jgi:hypothetical protein